MSELFPVPLIEQILCVERELAYRRRVYPRLIAAAKMSQSTADREITRMEAVKRSLETLSDNRK